MKVGDPKTTPHLPFVEIGKSEPVVHEAVAVEVRVELVILEVLLADTACVLTVSTAARENEDASAAVKLSAAKATLNGSEIDTAAAGSV